MAGSAAAQIPAQTPPPSNVAPDWQRPNIATADYVAAAKKDIDAFERKLADARQRANEAGRQDPARKFNRVEERLRDVKQHWEKLPQTNQANWDTVRRNFETAYNDMVRLFDEAARP